MNFLTSLVLLGLIQINVCHEAFIGSCPKVQPMEDFNMELGQWYVMELFEKGVKCMTWNFTQGSDEKWKVYETRQSGFLHVTGLDSKSITTATLTPKAAPGAFSVRWPLNPGGAYDFTVINTDYNTYASIFSCQGLIIGHRQQALVLSRQPTLQSQYRQIMKGKLQKFSVDPYYFHKVDHNNCWHVNEDENLGESFGPLGTSIKEDDQEYGDEDYYDEELFGINYEI